MHECIEEINENKGWRNTQEDKVDLREVTMQQKEKYEGHQGEKT